MSYPYNLGINHLVKAKVIKAGRPGVASYLLEYIVLVSSSLPCTSLSLFISQLGPSQMGSLPREVYMWFSCTRDNFLNPPFHVVRPPSFVASSLANPMPCRRLLPRGGRPLRRLGDALTLLKIFIASL